MSAADSVLPTGSCPPDLAQYFAVMLESFARVASKPYADGTVEVIDG
jgi:hypothetical protein